MGYFIKYDELQEFYNSIYVSIEKWQEELSSLSEKLAVLADLESFQGKTATSIKSYIDEVHIPYLVSISTLLGCFFERFLVYKNGFYQYEDDIHAELDQGTLEEAKTYFKEHGEYLIEFAEDLGTSIAKINDLIGSTNPSAGEVEDGFTYLKTSAQTLNEDLLDYETLKGGDEITELKDTLTAIVTAIGEQVKHVDIQSYQPGSVSQLASYQTLNDRFVEIQESEATLSTKINQAINQETTIQSKLQQEYIDEMAKQREEAGAWQMFWAGTTVVLGVTVMVLSCGTATPVVLGAVGYAAGAGLTACGVANYIDGDGERQLGKSGNITDKAYNPMVDAVFDGDEEAYKTFENTCMIVSALVCPALQGYAVYGSAVAAGNTSASVVRTVGVSYGKFAMSAVAGEVTKKVSQQFGASENVSNVFGLLGGFATGYGLEHVDRAFNLSGVNAKTIQKAKAAESKEVGPVDETMVKENLNGEGHGEREIYSTLRELMSSDEIKKYDEYWYTVAERISDEALYNQMTYIKNGGITKPGGGQYKPAKINATVDMRNGKIYFGYNGTNKFNPSRTEICPELQKRINYTKKLAASDANNPYASRESYEVWSVDNCAEVYGVNNAIRNGASLKDIFINTKYFTSTKYFTAGEYAPPCKNCEITFEGVRMPQK